MVVSPLPWGSGQPPQPCDFDALLYIHREGQRDLLFFFPSAPGFLIFCKPDEAGNVNPCGLVGGDEINCRIAEYEVLDLGTGTWVSMALKASRVRLLSTTGLWMLLVEPQAYGRT